MMEFKHAPLAEDSIGIAACIRPNFAVEQTAGSHSLARGCSPRRWADKERAPRLGWLPSRGL